MNIKGETIRIRAVGDVCLGEHPFCIGWGGRSAIRRSGSSFPFESVQKVLCDGDMVFANLEGPVSDSDTLDEEIGKRIFKGDQYGVNALKFAGFNVVSVANNHISQHGSACFQETVRLLALHDILPVGLREGGRTVPGIMEIRGIRCGVLAYSTVPDLFRRNGHHGTPPGFDEMIFEIRELKGEVDRVVVSCHWGLELMRRPERRTRVLAHAMSDAGADLLIGHHPHVLQGVEEYNDSLILYSLGNFFVDFLWSSVLRRSVIADIRMPISGRIEYRLIPVMINGDLCPVVSDTPGHAWRRRFMPQIDGIAEAPSEGLEMEEVNHANRLGILNQMHKIAFLFRNWKRLHPLSKRFVRDKFLGFVR